MKNEKFNQVIDEVYKHYQETHQYEPFILKDEINLSKEVFIKKATNNYGFSQLFGLTLNERELSFNEKVNYARSIYGKEDWWSINDIRVIKLIQSKIRVITLFYKGEEIESYE
jgi:hypothetical protein